MVFKSKKSINGSVGAQARWKYMKPRKRERRTSKRKAVPTTPTPSTHFNNNLNSESLAKWLEAADSDEDIDAGVFDNCMFEWGTVRFDEALV